MSSNNFYDEVIKILYEGSRNLKCPFYYIPKDAFKKHIIDLLKPEDFKFILAKVDEFVLTNPINLCVTYHIGRLHFKVKPKTVNQTLTIFSEFESDTEYVFAAVCMGRIGEGDVEDNEMGNEINDEMGNEIDNENKTKKWRRETYLAIKNKEHWYSLSSDPSSNKYINCWIPLSVPHLSFYKID